MGDKGLEIAAQWRVLTDEDLPKNLRPLIQTNEALVRVSIGRTAARLTTDRSLGILGNKFTEEFVGGFIKRARLAESKAGRSLTEEELAKEWLDWWTPLIPQYATPIRLVH